MGYYDYHKGLISRNINQDGGWDSHCERSRNFIINALNYHKPDKVTVLGSGWLLDLPLAEMLEKTKKVCLIDIVHPPDVIKQAGSLENVELIEDDVTGGLIEKVWEKAGSNSFFSKISSLDSIVIPEYNLGNDPGLVISLNILTQLEILPVVFLKRKTKIREEEYNLFRSEIQKKHIAFLEKNKSLIITDYAEVFTDRSGSKTAIPTLLTDLPQGRIREEWTWKFEQTKAYRYNSTSVMKVVAINI